MPFLSQRMEMLKPSATIAVMTRARTLRAEGHPIYILAGGEPHFQLPENLRTAVINAMDKGLNGYTQVDGLPEVKEAVRHSFTTFYCLSYNLDEILITVGTKQALFNAFLATLNPGDEAIVPVPYWVSYPDIITLAGGTPILVEGHSENHWKLTPDALAKSITPQTKWLLLNSPNNPSGAVYNAKELTALAEILRQHPQVHILCDDIYQHIIYPPHHFANIVQVAPDLKDRTVIINGLSKGYGVPGWRIGYAAGPTKLIQAMKTLQSQSTSCPNTLAQMAAKAALLGDHSHLAVWQQEYARHRDILLSTLNESPFVTCPAPQGAFYLFPDISQAIGRATPDGKAITDDLSLATYLLEAANVSVMPGSAFGMASHLRLSFAVKYDILVAAAKNIQRALTQLT